MRRSREKPSKVDVWPAFSDTMLAFLLVVIILLVFQVGRNIDIVTATGVALQLQIQEDQSKIDSLVTELKNRYGAIGIAGTDGNSQEITLGDQVLFQRGNADLSRQGQSLLSDLVQNIVQMDIRTLKEITVKGHTDAQPISTVRFPSNWELSTARASRVVRYLIQGNAGGARIDPNRVTLVASGYGPYVPIDSSDVNKNRRIELRLVYTNNPISE